MPTLAPVVSVEPTLEPVTAAEVKKQLELPPNDSTHDTHIDRLITQAREQFEHDTGIVCLTTTVVEKLDEWPVDYIELHRRPVQSVTSVAYLDIDGNSQTWSNSNYEVDTGRVTPVIWPAYNVEWPQARSIQNAITITYVAGDTSQANLSEQIRHAVLLAIAQEFTDREGMRKQYAGAYHATINRLMRATYP